MILAAIKERAAAVSASCFCILLGNSSGLSCLLQKEVAKLNIKIDVLICNARFYFDHNTG